MMFAKEHSELQAMGDQSHNIDLRQKTQNLEEEEEALSLCDLPLTNDRINCEDFSKRERRSQSDQEYFEFFSDVSAEMCPAEDVIFCGKLIPYKEPVINQMQTHRSKTNEPHFGNLTKKRNFLRSRSDSLNNESQSSRSGSAKDRLMRISRSLDYHRLHISSSLMHSPVPLQPLDRKPSGKCSGKYDYSFQREYASPSLTKSRWNVLMFGLVKFPPAMELKDIRNRQSRRNPSSLFREFDGRETVSVSKGERKGVWRLLRALSCKGHANPVVTASISCISHV